MVFLDVVTESLSAHDGGNNTHTRSTQWRQQYSHTQHTMEATILTHAAHNGGNNTHTRSTQWRQQYSHTQHTMEATILTHAAHNGGNNTHTRSTQWRQQYSHTQLLLNTCTLDPDFRSKSWLGRSQMKHFDF